jgi:DNA-binding protein H-NS
MPLSAGKCRAVLRRAIDTGTFRTWIATMADCNLEALTRSELKNMQKDVAEAISTFEDCRNGEARAKVEAFAHDLVYTRTELFGTETKSSRAPAAAKHRHPKNLSLAWSSRGCKGSSMANAPSK